MPLQRALSPRYKIKALSKQLRKLSFPSSSISPKLATFAVDAFNKFLSGECDSLDAAFGVRKNRGAPRQLSTAKQHRALAKKIFALRLARKTWYQIEEELDLDQRALRRIYAAFKVHLMSRNLLLTLKQSE